MKYLVKSKWDDKTVTVTGTTERDILFKTMNWLIDKGDLHVEDFMETLVDNDVISFTPNIEDIETI